MKKQVLSLLIILMTLQAFAQTEKPKEEKKWFEKMKLGGYAQLRYNRLLETNPDLRSENNDRSWGKNNSFYFRRLRLVYSGQISDRIFGYIQIESASNIKTTSENFMYLQIRDAYFDYGLDSKNEFRFRFGQSKVPFGFDNLQSSSVRLSFDRTDALNSGAPNERDLGAYFLWSPEKVRKLQKDTLTSNGLKGSGDYGVFMVGIYNGQTMNKPELNDQVHIAAKVSYPFRFGNQIFEPGVMAYAGRYVLPADLISTGVTTTNDKEYDDQRIAAGFILQPKPFGLVAEYNIGTGPQYSFISNSITNQKLQGGYILASYRKINKKNQIIQPFVRCQYYEGGKKLEKDARAYKLNETEYGIEYQISKNMEVTASWVNSHRITKDAALTNYDEKGSLLRLQLQINY